MGCWEGLGELVTELLILDTVCLELGADNRFGLNDWLLKAGGSASDIARLRVVVDCWLGLNDLATLVREDLALETMMGGCFGGKDGLVSSAKRGLFASSNCGQEVRS